ncbi:MAG: hypothetical protein R3C68_10735 [Myxococcota bacterium]
MIDTPLAETSIDVDARLVDTAGNAVVVDVGSVALDFDAPAASNIAWDLEGRTTIRDNETLRLSAEMSVDTQTAQLILLGDGVSELLRIPLLVDADGTGAAVFDLRNVDTLPWTTLSAQLSLEDAAGNTNDPTQDTAPDLTFDRLPPAVQIDAAPAVTSQQTQPTFEFSNAQGDIASIQCSLDGAQFVDCSSPWQLPELSLGEHRFEIISTDAAGNPQETPTVHVWTIDRHWRWVAAGSSHTCAIATDDSLWCWGKVTDGAIGAGIGETTLPVQVTAPERWRAVAAGAHNTCGIALDGTLWCWGSDSDGQLGIGGAMLADDLRVAPVQVGGESDWMTVSVGNASTCGIRGQTQGTLWCWGSLAGAATPQAIEAPVTDWLDIVVREGHACGIRNDSGARSAWCWGSGRNGELGFLPQAIGQATPSTSVDTTGVSGGWLQVAVGVQHSCGVTTTGELWCWGSDPQGQIGNGPGDSTEQETPTRIGSDSDWTAVVSNTNANCGLRGSSVFCWGENNHGGVDRTTVGTNAVAPIAPSKCSERRRAIVRGLGSYLRHRSLRRAHLLGLQRL